MSTCQIGTRAFRLSWRNLAPNLWRLFNSPASGLMMFARYCDNRCDVYSEPDNGSLVTPRAVQLTDLDGRFENR